MINDTIRVFDIIISIFTLIIFLPLLIIISILIITINGRPIIYKQIRIGYKGKKFNIYKFRTMSNDIFKDENLRLTTFGKILRKSSLDELPQLVNVLKQDMSIVGPRPLPESIEKKIERSLKVKRRNILPGITGFSQINYSGKKRKLIEKIKLDLEYIEHYSVYNYFRIIIKTPIILIKRFFKNKTSIIK